MGVGKAIVSAKRGGGNIKQRTANKEVWIPACAGMTNSRGGQLSADYVGDFHKARGIVAFGFGEFVIDKSDGFVQLGNNHVL